MEPEESQTESIPFDFDPEVPLPAPETPLPEPTALRDPLARAPLAALVGCGLSVALGLGAVIAVILVAQFGFHINVDPNVNPTAAILLSMPIQPMFVLAGLLSAWATGIPVRLLLALKSVGWLDLVLAAVGLLGASVASDCVAALVSKALQHHGTLETLADGVRTASPAMRFTLLLLIAITPAFGEEVLFRGVLFTGLRRYGATLAIVVTALLFAVMHFDLVQGIGALGLGLYLGLLRERSGSLWPGVAAHFANNSVAAVGMLSSKAGEQALESGAPWPLAVIGLLVAVACLLGLQRRDS